jgi:hypothetical protein
MVGPPLNATALELEELTWILFIPPPATTISPHGLLLQVVLLLLPPPFMCKVPESFLGSSTKIGIGEFTETTPHTETAPVCCLVSPLSIAPNNVGILSEIVTRMSLMGAKDDGASVIFGKLDGLGKST